MLIRMAKRAMVGGHKERIDPVIAGHIVAWMRYVQRDRGLNQRELARALGIDESHISKIYKGERMLGLGPFLRLHLDFSVRLEQLVHGEPPA